MTKGLKYLLLFILCIGRPVFANAQNKWADSVRIDSLLSKVDAQEDDTNKVKTLNDLAYAYHTADPYAGIKYGKQALSLAEYLEWEMGVAKANSVLGVNYYALSEFPVAYKYWEKALRMDEKMGFKLGIANQEENIGNIFFSQGNYEKAQENYRSALKKYEELGNKSAVTNSYTSIGNVFAAQKNYPEALEYHNKALVIDQGLADNSNNVAADLMNIGSVYTDCGQYAKALEYLFKALNIKRGSGDRNGIARTYGVIGKTFLRITNDTGAIATDSIKLSKTQIALQATAYLDSAIDIDEEIGFLDNLQMNSKYLSEAQELLLNYKDALASYKRYSNLKDSIYSAASTSKISEIEKAKDIEARDNELKTRQEQRKYMIIGIIALIIIIGSLAVAMRFVLKSNSAQKRSNEVIKTEKKKSDDLLLNILPAEVAHELKEKGTAEAKHFDNVTVLFTDFVNFTKISERLSPKELVHELNACFCAFDMIMAKYGVEKIKTIGDAYHAVCGLPLAAPRHADHVLLAAIEIRQFVDERKKQLGDRTFDVRIGVHSGSVVAGIVGFKKFTYDIWGDTVNTAARMEQNSEAGKINISQSTYELVCDRFSCSYRGMIDAKNKGELNMYFVENKLDH